MEVCAPATNAEESNAIVNMNRFILYLLYSLINKQSG